MALFTTLLICLLLVAGAMGWILRR